MPLAGPFVHLDFGAEPTEADDGAGGTILVYPPLPGLFAICDLDTFGQAADLLTPFRVYPVPAQAVLAGDDPADPQLTVTLHFADLAEAGPVLDAVNALPPVPAPPPVFVPPPPPVRRVLNYRFKIALRGFPTVTGIEGRTLRDDVEDTVAGLGGAVVDRWAAPEIYRNDPMLLAQAAALVGAYGLDADALLDAIFDAADLVP